MAIGERKSRAVAMPSRWVVIPMVHRTMARTCHAGNNPKGAVIQRILTFVDKDDPLCQRWRHYLGQPGCDGVNPLNILQVSGRICAVQVGVNRITPDSYHMAFGIGSQVRWAFADPGGFTIG